MEVANISNICHAQIKGDYWNADFLEFKVVMKKSLGLINATKLCNDHGTRFVKWLADPAFKDTAAYYKNTFVGISDADDNIRGIYVPSAMMFLIGSWISHEFGFNCAKIFTRQIGLVAETTNVPAMTFQEVSTGNKIIDGTYIHPYLFPHFMCYSQPSFALHVGKHLDWYVVKEYKARTTITQ